MGNFFHLGAATVYPHLNAVPLTFQMPLLGREKSRNVVPIDLAGNSVLVEPVIPYWSSR